MWSVWNAFETLGRVSESKDGHYAPDTRQSRSRIDRWSWVFVLVLFVGGDLVTTGLGIGTLA